MKKRYIIVLTGLLIGGMGVYWLISQPPLLFATSPPNKTYTVEVRGDKSRPVHPFIEHEVSFNVIKGGNRIVKNAKGHSGDWFDISFELVYPEHTWVNENVLKFRSNLHVPHNKSDTLSVRNLSGKVIKYLKINANDMFLIFDVQPQSTLTLTSSPQSWMSWIECEGEFADGRHISWSGVNFFHQNTLDAPLRYCISVSNEGVRIESAQFEGFDTKGSGDDPNVPKAENCNL